MFDARWPLAVCAVCAVAALMPAQPTRLMVDATAPHRVMVTGSRLTTSVTIASVPDVPRIARLAFYYDPLYARGRAMSDRFAGGFVLHAQAAFDARDLPVRAEAVDAASLARLLQGKSAGTCLFVAGGFLPAAVRSPSRDALAPWLRGGGCVIWMGAPFDAYYSVRGTAIAPGGIRGPYVEPWRSLYGAGGPLGVVRDVATQPLSFATIPCAANDAIGLTFDATTFPVLAPALERLGGTPIAFVDRAGRSSVSVLPIGAGRLVLFGDSDEDELDTAEQIAQLLATGAWYDPNAVRVLARLGPGSATIGVDVPAHHHAFVFGDPPYYAPAGR